MDEIPVRQQCYKCKVRRRVEGHQLCTPCAVARYDELHPEAA